MAMPRLYRSRGTHSDLSADGPHRKRDLRRYSNGRIRVAVPPTHLQPSTFSSPYLSIPTSNSLSMAKAAPRIVHDYYSLSKAHSSKKSGDVTGRRTSLPKFLKTLPGVPCAKPSIATRPMRRSTRRSVGEARAESLLPVGGWTDVTLLPKLQLPPNAPSSVFVSRVFGVVCYVVTLPGTLPIIDDNKLPSGPTAAIQVAPSRGLVT